MQGDICRPAICGGIALAGADTQLVARRACISPSLGSREFFLQKAIGWALRQYAWTDAAEIRKYVRLNRARLSNLSRREALKNIDRVI
jgi:3-methyladenine DNA glycosylase AlkD